MKITHVGRQSKATSRKLESGKEIQGAQADVLTTWAEAFCAWIFSPGNTSRASGKNDSMPRREIFLVGKYGKVKVHRNVHASPYATAVPRMRIIIIIIIDYSHMPIRHKKEKEKRRYKKL